MTRALLIYPYTPPSYFSFTYVMGLVSRKAVGPPLGLITIAPLLPGNWNVTLIDQNVEPLRENLIREADLVFISAMNIQIEVVKTLVFQLKSEGKKILAGGPLFQEDHTLFPDIDHFVLGEAENALPAFLKDWEEGRTLQRIYKDEDYADICKSPTPAFHLLKVNAYASMNLQLSRGCPYRCEFCTIPFLLGNKVRIKTAAQILQELDALYRTGFRGSVSIVDDNFYSIPKTIRHEILPALIDWMKSHHYPFIFNVQATVNLADDREMMAQFIEAGITATFLGIETLDQDNLNETGKTQNYQRDLLQDVYTIQQSGIIVSGGFILGFDHDHPSIFATMKEFIQESGIVWAMVGLLNAPNHTPLYERLEKENRIKPMIPESNTEYATNIIPKMNEEYLMDEFRSILKGIYLPSPFYRRIRIFLSRFNPKSKQAKTIDKYIIRAFISSVWILGMKDKYRWDYWKLFIWTLIHKPGMFMIANMFMITGIHFRKIYQLEDRLF